MRRLDLLVDDSDGVVLGALRMPALEPGARAARRRRRCGAPRRSLVRTLVRAPAPVAAAVAHRLRVEADGVLLSDLDRPVAGVSVRLRGRARAGRGDGAGGRRTGRAGARGR